MLVLSNGAVYGYDVIDPDVNFSDHLPLFASLECSHPPLKGNEFKQKHVTSPQLRWGRADLMALYEFTRCNFELLLQSINNRTQQLDNDVNFDYANAIDRVHDDIISTFNAGARLYVTYRRKTFIRYGFTWSSVYWIKSSMESCW